MSFARPQSSHSPVSSLARSLSTRHAYTQQYSAELCSCVQAALCHSRACSPSLPPHLADTNFYFECLSTALEGGMDRFCQFFRCPTFDKGMVAREVGAIDSEHNNNVPIDGRRLHQVFKRGLRPDHPASGFSTGNQETLLPPSRSTDELHEALVEFRSRW